MRLLWLIAMCNMVFLFGCEPSMQTSALKKKTLRLSIPEEPITLDPRRGGDAISSQLQFMLFEGLTVLGEDGNTRLGQSHRIDISEDLLTYTFHLGKTKWSDGSTVTAFDFEKGWKDILSPSYPAPNAHLLYPIQGAEAAKKGEIPLSQVGIQASDPYTLVVKLTQPTPYFLKIISFCVFFPVCKAKDQQDPSWSFHAGSNFLSNGPFILSEWKHHNELTMSKNPYYHAKESIHLDAIRIQIIPSEMTAFQMYENNELDFLGHPFSPIPYDAIDTLKHKNELKTSPAAATTLITFNSESSVFKNKNLRKAFALAIDREAIVNNMTQLGEIIATDAVPPILKNGHSLPLYQDNQKELAKHFLNLALKELNISAKDLQSLTFYYSQLDNHHKVAQVLQQQWLDTLGILVKLQTTEHKSLLDRLTKRDYSFALTIWRAQYFDPLSILDRFKTKENKKNYCGWENKHYAYLLDRSLHEDDARRKATLVDAEEILLEDIPVAPLYHWSMCFLSAPQVKNIELSPVGGIFFERLSLDDKTP